MPQDPLPGTDLSLLSSGAYVEIVSMSQQSDFQILNSLTEFDTSGRLAYRVSESADAHSDPAKKWLRHEVFAASGPVGSGNAGRKKIADNAEEQVI